VDEAVNQDRRYGPWLDVANELVALHEYAYGENGPLAKYANSPLMPTGLATASWIRSKCASGRWYWWDKSTLAGKADEPLRSIERLIGDSGGLFEESERGRELIERIGRLHARIDDLP